MNEVNDPTPPTQAKGEPIPLPHGAQLRTYPAAQYKSKRYQATYCCTHCHETISGKPFAYSLWLPWNIPIPARKTGEVSFRFCSEEHARIWLDDQTRQWEQEEQEKREKYELEYIHVPCRTCSALIRDYKATSTDYRFPRPFESESKGLCEGCKASLYLKRFAGLQRAYRDWLTVTYPTPSYIYGLIDPRSRDVCYIGRTADIAKRINDHRRDKRGRLKNAWITELHELSLTFEHCILAVAEPGYHVIELELRWIAEGIRRGWPLTNGEMAEPEPGEYGRRSPVARRAQEQQNIDFLTCDESNLHFPITIRRIQAYAAWSEQMLPAIPHWFVSKGAEGLMAHELDW